MVDDLRTQSEQEPLPQMDLTVSIADLPWLNAITHSLKTFPQSRLSVSHAPTEEGAEAQVIATGSPEDVERFGKLTNIVFFEARANGWSQFETSAQIVQALDLMKARQG